MRNNLGAYENRKCQICKGQALGSVGLGKFERFAVGDGIGWCKIPDVIDVCGECADLLEAGVAFQEGGAE